MGHYLCDLWQLLPQWSHSGIGQVALSSSLNFGIILKVSHGRLSWRGHAVSMREPYPADFHMNGLPVNSAACRGQVCWGSHRFSVLSLGYLQVAVGGGGLQLGQCGHNEAGSVQPAPLLWGLRCLSPAPFELPTVKEESALVSPCELSFSLWK